MLIDSKLLWLRCESSIPSSPGGYIYKRHAVIVPSFLRPLMRGRDTAARLDVRDCPDRGPVTREVCPIAGFGVIAVRGGVRPEAEAISDGFEKGKRIPFDVGSLQWSLVRAVRASQPGGGTTTSCAEREWKDRREDEARF